MANNQPHKGLLIIAGPKPGAGADAGGPPDLMPPDDDLKLDDKGDSTSGQQCSSCKFFKNAQSHGECLRYPPNDSGWPMVAPEDWCGEWTAGAQHGGAEQEPDADDLAGASAGQDLGAIAPGGR